MSYPKLEPCPECKLTDQLGVYTYDSGGRHVECDRCFYLGPAEGSIRQAIKSHNERVRALAPRSDAQEGV